MGLQLQGKRILCADDEERLTNLLRIVLESEGASVDVVADGAAALHEATLNSHDLVLMDLNMPGMSGIEAIRSIRLLMPDKPILVLTGYNTPSNLAAARAAGATACLTKPVKIEDLLDTVRAICEKPQTDEK